MMGQMMDGGLGGWVVLALVLLLLVVAAGSFGAGYLTARLRVGPLAEATAEDLLTRRFVTGEIDEDQFLSRLAALDAR